MSEQYRYFTGLLGDMEYDKSQGRLNYATAEQERESVEHQLRVRETITYEQYKTLVDRFHLLLDAEPLVHKHVIPEDDYFAELGQEPPTFDGNE